MATRSTSALVAMLAFAFAAGCDGDEAASGARRTEWKPCHDTFECTTVNVPVDYSAPGGPTIPIAVIRAPARDPEARLGALVVNPGGPGAPMVDRLVDEYGMLRLAFARVFERYDVVAFDWRGVGRSAPLACVDDAFFDELRAADLTLETPLAAPRLEQLARTLAEGCRASAGDAMLESLHTENAARDLDRIREALGESKLDYLGLSHGTWLGATYATLFPDRVGAFVLDAPVFLPADNLARIESRAKAHDAALDRFFTTCGADPSCAFHGGEGGAAVAQAFDAVLARASRGEILVDGSRSLSSTDAALAITAELRADEPSSLAAGLAKAEAGDGSALHARADAAAGKRADGSYDDGVQGQIAIGALELPFAPGTKMADLRSSLDALRARARSANSASIPWALAVGWPFHRREPAPAISAPSAAPMLVVAATYDPLTPHEDGVRLVGALANGSHLLTYEGGGHVALLHSDCVRGIVTDYFLDPSTPPRRAVCAPD
ncbi:MAG: hypothetical protein BGO98_36835 [Myxococcales bacterium 68-20]|nr:MAG: hypothetical protein BGO98_36835 [Myxococcales bacterium 68-20]